MKFIILLALAVVALSAVSLAEKTKGRRSSVFNLPANAKVRAEDVEQYLRIQNDFDDDDLEAEVGELRQAGASDAQVPTEVLKADSSKGRLFLKKFLLLGGLLGNKQQSPQPIIPIIITGNGGNSPTTPTTTTTTGTISGSGTVTTTPASRAGGIESDDYLIGEEDVVEDQQLYAKANSNKQQNYFKLKSGKVNQQGGLQFVVPPKYMRYFQNNPNVVAVNPSVYNNNGGNKMRKVRLNNNGNVKRKRSKSPLRRFVQQQ